ncbi:type VI secretion system secreted protein VgrG, partial [Phytobacter palmae]
TANALRFEDKAGEEQVWIQAERNMDTNVKNDETHTIEKNHTQFVGENETLRVVKDQNTGVKGNLTSLTGNNRDDKVVNTFTLAAGEMLRIECGQSAIELLKDGTVSIIGNNFNFTAAESAQINTLSGDLHLNPADGSAGTLAVGSNQQTAIQQEVDNFFIVKANK